MNIRYLLYASRLIDPLGHGELTDLLAVSQRNNSAAGLTGFLHIEERIVLQYLEGPPESLKSTIDRIRKDPRHTDLEILAEEDLVSRYFDGWQMALVACTTLSLFDLLGMQITDVAKIREIEPLDLITLLSANASFLRDRPAVA